MKPGKVFLLLLAAVFFSCSNRQANQAPVKTTDTKTVWIPAEVPVPDTLTIVQKDSAPPPVVKKVIKKKKPAANKKPEDMVSLNDIFRQVAKAPETFTLLPDKDTMIVCKEGTKIKIKGRSFVSKKTGDEIICDIQISVTEYYKMSDVLLANLSTTSGDEILESGGMIYITASSDSENCVLKKGEEIEISFPTQDRKDGMKLFTGKWKEEQIDWQFSERQPEPTYVDFAYFVDEEPVFRGGVSQMAHYIADNFLYPRHMKDKDLDGTIVLSFTVSETGKIHGARVVRALASELDSATLEVVRKMPDWIPGKQDGRNVSVQYRLFVNFISGIYTGLVLYGYRGDDWYGRSIDVDSDSSIARAGANNLSHYIFSTTQLGWINCDRFWEQNQGRINYMVSTEKGSGSIVRIVFHKFKGVMYGKPKEKGYVFQKIPAGEDITIVAITYKGGKPYLCIKDTRTHKTGEKDLVFEQPLTAEVLKAAMKNLDRLN